MSQSDPTTPAWDDALLKHPHEVQDKRRRVQQMFAAIAPSYDLNNRLHSFWQDQRWRRKAVQLADLKHSDTVVDVACGTGDLTINFAETLTLLADPNEWQSRVIGVDFTFDMLPLARKKWLRNACVAEHGWDPQFRQFRIENVVRLLNGDAQSIPLADQSADVASIAFGIRNVQDPMAALREFYRVLRPDGRVIILEFSLPTNRILRAIYNFYFRKILPRTATLISRDKTGAYKYLPESVCTFITRETMMQMMQEAGFVRVEQFPMTFGVCVCYRGFKPAESSPQSEKRVSSVEL